MMQSEIVQAPGPRQWPLVGNLGVFRGVLQFFEQAWREHGDVFRLRVGGQDLLVIAHPDLLQQVLVSKRHSYVKGRSYDAVRTIAGDSLLTLEGETWRARRTLAQPAFHRQSLEKLTQIMVDTGARYFSGLERRCGTPLDMHQEMVRLTLDVVVDTLFGRGTIESSQISFDTLNQALELVSLSVSGVQLPAWVPTPHNLKLQRTVRALNDNVFQIIRIARERGEEGTLLSMLLDERDEHGQPLSDQALRDEVITFVLAGHETTALTLTWFFALLEHRPEVLAHMRDEVDQVLGGDAPTFATLPKLVYVRQVVDEVLRLRPPGAMIGRNAIEADELGGYHVAPGQVVTPFIWAAHRHPDFWDQPERFMPERAKPRHPAAYLPFSVGPRTCIGNSFALFEAVILLAQLIARFEIEIGDCSDVRPQYMGSVRPSRPVRVKLTPRRSGGAQKLLGGQTS
ncbi:MAG: cytochrome P450 [Polyangiales bacterium]